MPQAPVSHIDHRPATPAPAAVVGGDRLFHADAGLHHRQHRAAGHGAQPGRKPAAHAGGGGRLRADDGGGDPGHRLAGRPLWHAAHLPAGDRPVHPGFGRLRGRAQPDAADGGARAAGRGRRHAAAGGPAGGAARVPERAVPGGDELRRHPRPGGPADRPHTGRLAGRGGQLALDLPDQPAGGPAGPAGDAAPHAQPAPRQPGPVRSGRLSAVGGGHGQYLAVTGRPGRPRLGPHAGGAADGAGPGGAGRVLAARAAQPGAAVRPGAVCRGQLPRGRAGQPVCPHRLGCHALPVAAAVAAGAGLLAGAGRHDDAAGGAGQHRHQARHHRTSSTGWATGRCWWATRCCWG
jgi:hypothetical protein